MKLTHWQGIKNMPQGRELGGLCQSIYEIRKSIWLFLLLIFDSFQTGFKGLSKIATIPKQKTNQWRKLRKRK